MASPARPALEKHYAQAFKYVLVGGLNTAVGYLSFLLLFYALGMEKIPANAISYVLGLVNSFIWNKLWTFKARGFSIAEVFLFLLVFLPCYGVQFAVFRGLDALGLPAAAAQALAVIPYTILSFVGNKLITFRKENDMSKSIHGATMLITGASAGIGRRLAELAAERGYGLVLVARSADKLEALAAELKAARGIRCDAIPADLSLPGAAAKLHAECAKRGIRVDLLVNNAGIGLFGAALEQDIKDIDGMLRLNVQALTELCVLFGRDMAAKGGGRILNIASMVGLMPVPYFSTYAATKAYVRSYSLALRAELKSSRVIVSCVLPGYVRTNFDSASQVSSEDYRKFSERMGMDPGRVARIALGSVERGRGHVVAGVMNSIAAFFVAFTPKAFIAWATNGFMRGLLGKR
jgi:uncharacterized protein